MAFSGKSVCGATADPLQGARLYVPVRPIIARTAPSSDIFLTRRFISLPEE
jgi:hypothetical protein